MTNLNARLWKALDHDLIQGLSLLGMWPSMWTFWLFFSESKSSSLNHPNMLAGSVLLISSHLQKLCKHLNQGQSDWSVHVIITSLGFTFYFHASFELKYKKPVGKWRFLYKCFLGTCQKTLDHKPQHPRKQVNALANTCIMLLMNRLLILHR